MGSVPGLRVLDGTECEELLKSQMVGRLAFTYRNRIDITPVHYVFHEGWIFGRTSAGNKVSMVAHHPWVAFEVDEIDSSGGRSVVLHGRIEFPDPEGSEHERRQHEAGVMALRSLIPSAFSESDPTPERDLLFRLPVSEMTGRAITYGGQ